MDDGVNGNQEELGALPEGYNDTNRAFLQAFMSRGSLSFEEGQSIIAAILSAAQDQNDAVAPESITRDVFNNYVHAAHEILLPLDLDIRSTRHQKTKDRIWALVNVESDLATQLATVHTPDEMAYINRLLDLMFEKFNTPRMEIMAVEENECFKISRPARPPRQSNADEDEAQTQGGDKALKHSEILTLLANLVAEGWLEKSRAGFYSLTPRSLMELKGWLVETYNDNEPEEAGEVWQPIKFCEFCKEIVTVGQRCGEPECLTRIHDICQRSYWESRPDKKCPRCEKEWSEKLYVGERAVTATEAYGRSKRKSNGGRRRSRQEDAEEDNVEEDED
ncbi:RING-like domain-containing protein [Coniochaeta ligniaria NRRL 30616]|uniref:Non-structural maintenance of chromosomes element 1 homolog n=1 Tax=Coniochaeta ligniaria NRRL 30616 TaxID=1408157 RepID=A0A1J7JFC3_9PEZI|nr:RING-like domain-containing protein [Coniochaeta ligniaria NRRL 30616]